MEELKANDKWVLPALKQIKEICSLYQEQPNQVAFCGASLKERMINQLHGLYTDFNIAGNAWATGTSCSVSK